MLGSWKCDWHNALPGTAQSTSLTITFTEADYGLSVQFSNYNFSAQDGFLSVERNGATASMEGIVRAHGSVLTAAVRGGLTDKNLLMELRSPVIVPGADISVINHQVTVGAVAKCERVDVIPAAGGCCVVQ